MPFPFVLPTTSTVLLSDFFGSATHPSLPLTATSKRSVVKDALKRHKRLPPRDQGPHLSTVQRALLDYIPYLLALNSASAFQDVGRESIDLQVKKPLECEWRTTLTPSLPGREPSRPKLIGLHHEIAFVLATLAHVYTLMARSQLWTLADSTKTTLSTEQRTQALTTAMKHLLESHSILTYSVNLTNDTTPIDVQPTTLQALAALSLAEANLAFLSKDDPYLSAAAQDRNTSNKEWMYVPPSIPKVRAHLYARIALAASEHATQASGLLSTFSSKLTSDLPKYTTTLASVSRARAARFLAIDAELSSKTGEALAWLNGAHHLLSPSSGPLSTSSSSSSSFNTSKKLSNLKNSLLSTRETQKITKTASDNLQWGLDAGKFEEMRVVEMLFAKWDRENSTYNVQVVPPFDGLLSGQMPSGRNSWNDLKAWEPPALERGEWEGMRAPVGPEERGYRGEEEDSGGEEDARGPGAGPPWVGAFPEERSESRSTYF